MAIGVRADGPLGAIRPCVRIMVDAAFRLRMDVLKEGSLSPLAADFLMGRRPVLVAGSGGGSSTAMRSCAFISSSVVGYQPSRNRVKMFLKNTDHLQFL